MAKQRYLNTKFWSDTWVSDLDPIEKLLFAYFITNERTEICGVYELPLKFMATETGIEKEMIEKILKRFEKDGKIIYREGWILVKNFIKHQAKNPKIEAGIKLCLERIPKHIADSLSIAYTYPMDSLSHPNPNPNPNPNNKVPVALTAEVTAENRVVRDLITLFKEVNPSYANLFKRKAEWDAMRRMIKVHTEEQVRRAIGYLPFNNSQPYSKTITKPTELEEHWGKLVAFLQKKKNEKSASSKIALDAKL